jgi:hypothetical protein
LEGVNERSKKIYRDLRLKDASLLIGATRGFAFLCEPDPHYWKIGGPCHRKINVINTKLMFLKENVESDWNILNLLHWI